MLNLWCLLFASIKKNPQKRGRKGRQINRGMHVRKSFYVSAIRNSDNIPKEETKNFKSDKEEFLLRLKGFIKYAERRARRAILMS